MARIISQEERQKTEDLNKLWKQIDMEYQEVKPYFRELARYFDPSRQRFDDIDHNSQVNRNYNTHMIDMQPAQALSVLSGGLMSSMTNPAVPWIKLTLQDQEKAAFGPIRNWLDEVAKMILHVLGKSNFYNVMPNIYSDGGLYATNSLFMEEDPVNLLRFYHLPMGTYRIANGAMNTIQTLGRELHLTVIQMVEKFGFDVLSDSVQKMYTDGQYFKHVPVYHLIHPREAYDPEKFDSSNMPYSSIYWQKGQDGILKESGYRNNPNACGRWTTIGSDAWGSLSPAMLTLGQARGLQKDQQQKFEAQEKMIRPPMIASSSLRNSRATLVPGGITYVDNLTASSFTGFQPAFQSNFRVDYTLQSIQDTRQQIKDFMYTDLFLSITNIDKSNTTAEEIARRNEEKLLLLGPVVNRMNEETLNPVVERTYSELLRRGQLPDIPDELRGDALNIEYQGIMAQAQKLVSLTSQERATSYVGNLAALYPDIVDKFNADKAVDAYFDTVGADPHLLNDDEVVEQKRQQRAAQQRAEQIGQMAQPAQQAADAAKLLSETDTGGQNALKTLQDNLRG